jgi:hypothetical protein
MSRRRRLALLLLVPACVVTACGAEATATPTPTPSPAASPVVTPPAPDDYTPELHALRDTYIMTITSVGKALFDFHSEFPSGPPAGQPLPAAQPVISALQGCKTTLHATAWPVWAQDAIAKLEVATDLLLADFQAGLETGVRYSTPRDIGRWKQAKDAASTVMGVPF